MDRSWLASAHRRVNASTLVRIGLLSDIHGNLTALEAVIAALGREGSLDRVIVAGDLLQGGPRALAVWERLLELGWTLVRGNEDETLAGTRALVDWTQVQRAQLAWQRERIGPDVRRALAALPASVRVPTPSGELLVVHASPRDTDDRRGAPHNTPEEVAQAYGGTGAAAIAFGHWHESFVRATPFALLINVASVGQPRDRLPLAAHTILTAADGEWTVSQRRVPYDASAEVEAAAAAGMPPWEPSADRHR